MNFKLIKLTSDRIDDYLELDNQCFSEHYSDTLANYDTIFNELKKNDTFYYIGVNDKNEIVCNLHLRLLKDPKCLQIKSICVSKSYRNQKIASYLLEFVEKFAKRNKLGFVFLITNKHNNDIALKMYETRGYKEEPLINSKFLTISKVMGRVRLFKKLK